MPDLLERLRAALADRYAIESEIGRGGMAVVFLAEDLKHHRKVAIKVLHPELTATLGAERFLQEIEIAARLDHPHIVALFDSGEADGLLFYVMPYVEGETLRERLHRDGQLPIDEAIQIAREVSDGLVYAHEHGVVHRDVKPANILLSAEHARIADFGIARAIDAAAEDRATATGLAAGTPMYMAPEQATGEARGDERSDIYSVGCMLYEMLVGEPPFSGVTPQVVQARKMTESTPSIRMVRDTVSPGLDDVVGRSIARVPADRFQTALELKRALENPERAQQQGVTSRLAQPEMRRRPRLSPARVIVALLAVTALGYAGMSFVDSGPGPGIDKPEIRSLAVLPLHNRSEDQNQEHISDGLTEALIDELAQINALERLPSLTTAMAYKGADKTLPEIARELSVDALIEGSWLRSGDEVEIRLRLIHGNSEEQLWSAEFAGNVSNVPTFLRRVSQAAADSIHVALSPAERERLAQRAYSPDPEAYDAYMMGRYHFWRFKDVDAPKANQYFEEAIALDPMYALAHAALAENCIFLTVLDPLSSTLEVEKCERLARRALELDEDLPDAHSALALVKTLKWDWEGAEESFRRAIDLKPNSVTAHLWYGWFLSIVMRLDESLVEARRAEELDRRNLLVKTMVAQPLMNAHRYDEALAQMDAVLEMDPDYGAAHLYKSHAYALSGRPNEALESARRAANDLGEDYLGVHVLEGWYHALVGETDLALATIDRIQELFGEDSAPSVAMIYLALGREEDALQGLEVGYRAHSPWLPNQTSWANLDGLRDHPRFVEMRRGMGLE